MYLTFLYITRHSITLTEKTPRACSGCPTLFTSKTAKHRRNSSDPTPYDIYNVIPYDKTHSLTLFGKSPWAYPGLPCPVHVIKT